MTLNEFFNKRELELSVLLYKASLEYYVNANDYRNYRPDDPRCEYNDEVKPLCDLNFGLIINELRESIAYRCEVLGETNRLSFDAYANLLQWRWRSIYVYADVRQVYESTGFRKPRKFIEPKVAFQSLLFEFTDPLMASLVDDLYNWELYVTKIVENHNQRLQDFADKMEVRQYGHST